MLTGLAPLIDSHTRLLILGSFPGVASLASQQYYGHPQNSFWKMLHAIWPDGPSMAVDSSYQNRSKWLLSKRVGLWDVYAACERAGSLDSAIRNAKLNDFSSLKMRCPKLQAIAHNGGESFRHSRHTVSLGLPVFKLPSTSPANASMSFERKLAAWREVFDAQGLV
ncbi:MAG TPA: DNA-deoxyinosine glycosylase [Polaromonas sp.]|uniref:DNA-deoxyinosine glycosylase n=1 Tax=Polaromonas sp. TaxID=1869339 RepID=UPI002D721ED6|nr:DNA-deoxyinosine glycosylase [Polaromonas sp.]HYW56779.1 DNA-deoxyinosine glycosylase [Polaromonas sp.]